MFVRVVCFYSHTIYLVDVQMAVSFLSSMRLFIEIQDDIDIVIIICSHRNALRNTEDI